MTQNMLKLNDSKTDYIIYLSSSFNVKSLKTPGLQIGESCILHKPLLKLNKLFNYKVLLTVKTRSASGYEKYGGVAI